MQDTSKKSPLFIGAIALLVLIVASYGVFKYVKKDDTIGSTVTPTPSPVSSSYSYKNGTYSAVGEYLSPGGEESIGIEVTVKDDLIVDAKATPKATRTISVKMQDVFSTNFKAMIVGKKLGEVSLDKVSGSSLTPKGFNDAIVKIRTQAKV